MLVTEGSESKKGRVVYVASGAAVLGAAASLPFWWVTGAGAVLWGCLFLAGGMVLRSYVYSTVGRFLRPPHFGELERRPGISFIIPCLNELPSLRNTVPRMFDLAYEGKLRFCYVVEGASTDGSLGYLQQQAEADPRIHVIEKTTPPGGRGAAVQNGLDHAPELELVGFLDADHVLEQDSFDEMVRGLASGDGPPALQGRCATIPDGNLLSRVLTVERAWMERVELDVTPRLGGLCLFGGGQGFFRREVLEETGLRIDESMILDDIDLSIEMALRGYRVRYDPGIVTHSTQPGTFGEFLDQRSRWIRGWIQLLSKFWAAPLRRRAAPLRLRADLVRLLLTPFGGVLLFLGFGSGLASLVAGGGTVPPWLAAAGVLWPFSMGLGPYLAGSERIRPRTLLPTLVGLPLLLYAYCALAAASIVEGWILRMPVRYAKTNKPG